GLAVGDQAVDQQQVGRQAVADGGRVVAVDHGIAQLRGQAVAGAAGDGGAAGQQRQQRCHGRDGEVRGAAVRLPHRRSGLPVGAQDVGSVSKASAASSVFCISVATVIGPTPPGTGVIQVARLAASSKPASPTRRPFSGRLMATAMATAPGYTHSAGMMLGRPTANTRMSAARTCCSSTSRGVNLWQQVVVQPAISSSSAIGRPTWLLTPTMVALRPRTGWSV